MEEDEMFYAASALNEGDESDSEEDDTAMYHIPEEKENINRNGEKINYKLLNKQKIEEMQILAELLGKEQEEKELGEQGKREKLEGIIKQRAEQHGREKEE